MTRQQAKHMSEILKAYSEGKEIQFRTYLSGNDAWTEWYDYKDNIIFDTYNLFGQRLEYRIKPNPIPRPYKDVEFIEAQKKHGQFLRQLFLDTRLTEHCYIATHCNKTTVKINDVFYTYDKLLESFVWADDDSICGILEEQ